MTDSCRIGLLRAVRFACLSFFAGACSDSEILTEPRPVPVVLYIVDTLRADRLGFNGAAAEMDEETRQQLRTLGYFE